MEKETAAWSEMASNLADIWVETGTQMWKNWFDVVGAAATGNTAPDLDPELEDASQRFANNQEVFARLVKLSFKAWKEISPQIATGEDWLQVQRKYTEQMYTQLDQSSREALKASQDMAQLWQLYIKEMQQFGQLWTAALGVPMPPISEAVNGTSEPWLELSNFYWDFLYGKTFGNLMQSPTLGLSREFNSKVQKAFDAWKNLYRANIDYQLVLANIQIRSFEELMQELTTLSEQGKNPEGWQAFQKHWSRVADRVFEEEFCNEDKLKIRGNFLNAFNTYRLHQQGLMELWLKTMNMPVRSEVDEVHKNIYELRKGLKSLNKTLAKYEGLEQETQQLHQEIETLNEKLVKYEGLEQETQQLHQEIKTLNKTLTKYEGLEQETQQLHQEIETLNEKLVKYDSLEQETQQLHQAFQELKQIFNKETETLDGESFLQRIYNSLNWKR